ncbi:MAG: hypothetical protein AB9873_04670 [Syntrophobacteraceae bacterium]
MKTKDAQHLGEDRLMLSLADESSLDPRERDHLRDCPLCSGERNRVERALTAMARTASALTPPMRRKPTLPSPAVPRARRKLPGLSSALVNPWMIGAAAAVALVVALGGLLSRHTREGQLAGIRQEIMEDARFLRELSDLEESSLPDLCVAFSQESDSEEEDFLDFVVPDTDGDPTTQAPAGGLLC